MNISIEELQAKKYQRGGTVVYPPGTPLRCLNPGAGRERREGLFRVEITWPGKGWATYIHIVNHEFKKAGSTGTGNASFKTRMEQSYGCLRLVIAGGPPYRGDPWKRYAPATILAQQEIELWVKPQPSIEDMFAEEDALNRHYMGEWSKEGWTRDGMRR